MKGTLTVVHPSGEITKKEYSSEIPLEDLQKTVGGYIELVPFFTQYEGRPCRAFCNEYGKLNQLPYNEPATALWEQVFGRSVRPDFLVGSIAIVTGDREFMEEL